MQNPLARSDTRRIAIISLLLFLALTLVLVRAKCLHDRAFVPLRAVTVPNPYPRMAQSVGALAFSPNGQTLAEVESLGNLRLLDAETLRQIQTIAQVADEEVRFVGWSSDGKTLAIGDSSDLRLWNVAGSPQTRTPREYHSIWTRAEINRYSMNVASPSLALAANGKTRGQVDVWDTRTNRHLFAFPNKKQELSGLTFSFDDKILAVATILDDDQQIQLHPEIKLYQARTGQEQRVLHWETAQIEGDADFSGIVGHTGLAFSPNSKLLASVDYATVVLWDVQSGAQVRTLRDEGSQSWGGQKRVAFSPDGRLVAAVGWGPEIKIWAVTTGQLLQKFQGAATTEALAFSPDGKLLATGGQDKDNKGTLSLWDISDLR